MHPNAPVPEPDRRRYPNNAVPPRNLRLVCGVRSIAICRIWRDGLSVHLHAGPLPGFVHIQEGDRHLGTGLICSDSIDGDEHRFAFKRMTWTEDAAPRDFAPKPKIPRDGFGAFERVMYGFW